MRKLVTLLGAFIVISCALFTLTSCGNDRNLEEKTISVSEDFNSISIISDTADITFLPANDGKFKAVSSNHKDIDYTANVVDDTLKLEADDNRNFFARMFGTKTKTLTVYLPKSVYNSLTIENSTGDINISNEFSFNSIDIDCSTGDVKIENIRCGSLDIEVSTGDITLNNISADGNINLTTTTGDINARDITCFDFITDITTGDTTASSIYCTAFTSTGTTGNLSISDLIASGSIFVERTTGNVSMNRCDASEITLETNTGDVTGSLLSPKVFIYKTSTGDVSLPQTTTGGTCKINTSTGDIKITLAE